MEIKQITDLIENFAPLELQEGWDCSGWQIFFGVMDASCGGMHLPPIPPYARDIKKVLLCVSITQEYCESSR